VARVEAVLDSSEISSEDVAQDKAGNRFDVPGGGILYCATMRQGCYAETLSRFRPSAAVREAVSGLDPNHMAVGGVPADWRARRVMARLRADNPLPFLDVADPRTHEYLTSVLAGEIAALDIAHIDDDGELLYSVGRELISPGTPALTEIADRWGLRIF
jgi:hypothetical protein